ncbi:MAG: HDOD domain-containing protein [Phycisphaerales bacterium]|nr:HDOD domain-containing protein [Phycisphaerales bacterium]
MTSQAPGNADAHKVELVLAQLEAIPPLAAIATRILALTEDSKSNARQIVELISADPALTTRILSILNRAEHGLGSKVVTIENAVLMLGFNRVRQITLALKVMEVFGTGERPAQVEGFDRAEFWKHCLAVACGARRIAVALNGSTAPEEAFVCGLLHDIGKIALETAMPKSFERVVRKANQHRLDIYEVEHELIGVDHTVVGHRLAERWNLPPQLTECIRLHHQPPTALPPSVATGRHVQIVQLADILAREQRIGYSGNHRMITSSQSLAEQLGLAENDRLSIIESLVDEIEQRAAWIGAEEINSRAVYFRALMQTTEELTSTNAELSEQNRRLERKADYSAALRILNQEVSPRASIRKTCAAGAMALRRALDIPSVLVFVASEDRRWAEVGLCDGNVKESIDPDPIHPQSEADETLTSVELAKAGTWIAPPGQMHLPLIDRYRGTLGPGPLWLLPIVREQRWVGGALFAAATAKVTSLRMESEEIEGLSTAIGLAISQAQAQAAALRLGDELMTVNRRLVTTRDELLQAKTLESVVTMAAGAAHELNNPLAVISGRAQMLLESVRDADVRETLETILKQTHACSDIVTELMAFARSPSPEPEAVDLGSCIKTLRTELSSAGLVEVDALNVEGMSDTPPVWFDRRLLNRLLKELIQNAIEATDSASRRLTVKAVPHLAEECVVITVTDNGRGMTAKALGHAMDPFFSNRPAGRGRGLGLSRVQRWLQQGGGAIRIDSTPGQGTHVEVQLPIAHGSL